MLHHSNDQSSTTKIKTLIGEDGKNTSLSIIKTDEPKQVNDFKQVPESGCCPFFSWARFKSACYLSGIFIMTVFETLFFASTMLYFIATVCDLLIYPTGLPPHQIIWFSSLAFTIAAIPSILVFLGATYVKAVDLIYSTSTNHRENDKGINNDLKKTVDESCEHGELTQPEASSNDTSKKKLTWLEKFSIFMFCVRVAFEAASSAFWFIFLYDHNQKFFVSNRLAILFICCMLLGIVRGIAAYPAYMNTLKKNKNKNSSPASMLDAKENKLNLPIGVYIAIGGILTSVGCLCMRSELKDSFPFLSKMPMVIIWLVTLTILIGSVYSEGVCNHAKLVINTNADRDQSQSDEQRLSINPKHLLISVLHNLAHFLQKTFPACLSLEAYLIEQNYFPQKYLRMFWGCVAVPALVWAVITIRYDLYNLREYEMRNQASSNQLN